MSAALPVVLSRFERHSMPAAEEKLSDLLGLAWDRQMQDWDLTNANPELLPALFVLLLQQEMSDDVDSIRTKWSSLMPMRADIFVNAETGTRVCCSGS